MGVQLPLQVRSKFPPSVQLTFRQDGDVESNSRLQWIRCALSAPNPRGCCNPVTSDARGLPGSQEICETRNWRNSVILIQEQDMRKCIPLLARKQGKLAALRALDRPNCGQR